MLDTFGRALLSAGDARGAGTAPAAHTTWQCHGASTRAMDAPACTTGTHPRGPAAPRDCSAERHTTSRAGMDVFSLWDSWYFKGTF